MTIANPTFNPQEFELRNYTNDYLSPDQAEEVNLVESRVNGQLDFLAQMLGWSGDNYWGNLPDTVSQKRQLLGGTYGVYNSFIVPKVLSVRSWENIEDFDSPRVGVVEIEKDNRIRSGQNVYLDFDSYQVLTVTETPDRMVLNFGAVADEFFDAIGRNVQLKVDVREARPAPFNRPTIGIAGDASFLCKNVAGGLKLYPAYDTKSLFPYLFPILFVGSTYYFDKPVYLSSSQPFTVSVSPVYDPETNRWALSIPEKLSDNSLGVVAYLVWSYSDSTAPVDCFTQVSLQQWRDPSDWNSESVLQYFFGAWGNKGGALPFNAVFDSLSIHGFDETNSIFLPDIEKTLPFNDLVDLVYSQRSKVDSGIPGILPPGKLWWNTSTGKLAVQFEQEKDCPFWVQTVYREAPEQDLIPEFAFPDAGSFAAGQFLVPESTSSVFIANVTGLSSAQNVLGLGQPLLGPGGLYIHKQPGTNYWVPIRFVFANVTEFNSCCNYLPPNVPTYISNSSGLSPVGVNYSIQNLEITVSGNYESVLVRQTGSLDWVLFPDSILRFIANSSLEGGPLEGEMWWDFANSNPETRNAKIFVDSEWVDLNSRVAVSSPPAALDLDTVLFYCEGNLLTFGLSYSTSDYAFTVSKDTANGDYQFLYKPFTLKGRTQFPLVEISDSLTSSYRQDVSELIFGGTTYQVTPNVYDATTPLRIWKPQNLQVVDSLDLLDRGVFQNPFVADLNKGPGSENNQRYFIRLPLDYGRNEAIWQKVALTCQDFAYFGSTIEPEAMRCPPGQSLPKVYEEVVLDNDLTDYTYVYIEPFLYSTVIYDNFSSIEASYSTAAVRPTVSQADDEFEPAEFTNYDPLNKRLVDFSTEGYGNWQGIYLNVASCGFLSGYYVNDLENGVVEPIAAPIWDASIYKCPPSCDNPESTYTVDANNYKICYAYFIADASAAEDPFFDIQAETSWRTEAIPERNLYILPPVG